MWTRAIVTPTPPWPLRTSAMSSSKYMRTKTFDQDPADGELKAGFAAKRARIGARQGLLLDYLTNHMGRPYLSLDDLADKVAGSGNELYYRLEQLRLLG